MFTLSSDTDDTRSQSVDQNQSSSFQSLAEDFSVSILCNHLETVIRQIGCVTDQLEGKPSSCSRVIDLLTAFADNDRSFVHRWITQSVTQGSSRLRGDATALAQRIGMPTDAPLESTRFLEQCPACRAVISLGTSGSVTCPNGHIWGRFFSNLVIIIRSLFSIYIAARCSVTFFLMATPFVRTCVGCRRKTLLPPPPTKPSSNSGLSWLPPAATSWIVEEMLQAANWCIFCGNRFVRVL